ncbi:hypothetical protein [Methanothrix harundinacea]|uniref:hypothetical protein n=1 Tax=Methanothrix harundinacea TaxID=301375 RepID=UPI00117CF6E8|nr:hypothetical protein [Methanothrix harundinacea]
MINDRHGEAGESFCCGMLYDFQPPEGRCMAGDDIEDSGDLTLDRRLWFATKKPSSCRDEAGSGADHPRRSGHLQIAG